MATVVALKFFWRTERKGLANLLYARPVNYQSKHMTVSEPSLTASASYHHQQLNAMNHPVILVTDCDVQKS